MRNTQDVDVLLRRGDFEAAKAALGAAGFIHTEVLGVDVFKDGPNAKMRDRVHVIFAGERVKAHETVVNPDVTASVPGGHIR